jgi:hypothetical protein
MTCADDFVSSGCYKIIPRSKYFAEQAFERPAGLQNVDLNDGLMNIQSKKTFAGIRFLYIFGVRST